MVRAWVEQWKGTNGSGGHGKGSLYGGVAKAGVRGVVGSAAALVAAAAMLAGSIVGCGGCD